MPFFDDGFKAAGARARIETLTAGVPVFYHDDRRKIDVMQEASGRKFEIRFLRDVTTDQNYQAVRELDETAA